MYNLYMDCGTTNTRAYLVKELELVDSEKIEVGTKDSAISGSNDVLLSAMKKCCDKLLINHELQYRDIEDLWASGVVTNTFGIIEVDHISVPLDGHKLLDNIYVHYEDKFFKRNIKLIRGVKTAQPSEVITMENISYMNNARGEETEVVGMVSTGIMPKNKECIMISPGSHTHFLYVADGTIVDIVSNFTGELNYAIKKSTILGGELSDDEIDMEPEYVFKGYQYLKQYGICRALYIVHATRVFDICSDEIRSQILAGIISGSIIDLLAKRIAEAWGSVEKIIIIGGKSYVESYRILCEKILPEIPVRVVYANGGKSFALCGFLELLRLSKGIC